MMWVDPKTNWKWISAEEGDYFNPDDYNRIKNNLEYLHTLALTMYKEFSFVGMGADKDNTGYPYADEINKLADNLGKIVDGTYPVSIGVKVEYVDNGPFIDYIDLNRIEKGCLDIYNLLNLQKEHIPQLPGILGIQRIGGL